MDSTINNFLDREVLSHIYLPSEIILNLIVSFLLGLVVSIVYKKTHVIILTTNITLFKY